MRSAERTWEGRVSRLLGTDSLDRPAIAFRGVALACALGLIASYVIVLREITRFVGGTDQLLTIVAVALGLALVAAPLVSERVVIPLGGLAAIAAFVLYFSAAGVDLATLVSSVDKLLSDVVTLATGLELIRVVQARTMALAYAPVPAFLTWYLALRGRYGAAVVPAGLALGFLVLTGDAWTTPTLGGAIAGAGAVAFGELSRRNAGLESIDVLTVVVVAMVFSALFVPLVPGGGGEAELIDGTGSGTLEGSIAGTPDRSLISGSVDLSPGVRFTVESDRPTYWRTAVYDRYAGDEWVTTGGAEPYDGPLDPPPGATDRITQTVTVESSVQVMPVGGAPIAVRGDMAQYTEVSEQGQFYPSVTLTEGDSYTVESAIVDPSSGRLQQAGTDYPDAIAERYLQTPDDRSGAFAARTDEIVADAETPYEKAARIEAHLRDAKSYSLDVDRPDGDVAESFLLEMDEGYCVYFATTMVQMLREEGIPARYATGYTEGEHVGESTWVVRGTDAHAWPEVYFPDVGWVAFEPTPPDERDEVHSDRVEQARNEGLPNVDTDESEPDDEGEEPPPDDTEPGNESDPGGPTNESPNGSPTESPNGSTSGNESAGGGTESPGSGGFQVPTPSPEQLALTALLGLGVVAAAHRTGVGRTIARTVRLYWQRPSGDPATDAERAYRRLEVFLARTYRPRRPAESPRSYLEAIAAEAELDDRVYEVFRIRERAAYGPGVDRSDAATAMELMDELAGRYRPLVGTRD